MTPMWPCARLVGPLSPWPTGSITVGIAARFSALAAAPKPHRWPTTRNHKGSAINVTLNCRWTISYKFKLYIHNCHIQLKENPLKIAFLSDDPLHVSFESILTVLSLLMQPMYGNICWSNWALIFVTSIFFLLLRLTLYGATHYVDWKRFLWCQTRPKSIIRS